MIIQLLYKNCIIHNRFSYIYIYTFDSKLCRVWLLWFVHVAFLKAVFYFYFSISTFQHVYYYYYYLKRSAVQSWERVMYTLLVRKPQPHNTKTPVIMDRSWWTEHHHVQHVHHDEHHHVHHDEYHHVHHDEHHHVRHDEHHYVHHDEYHHVYHDDYGELKNKIRL